MRHRLACCRAWRPSATGRRLRPLHIEGRRACCKASGMLLPAARLGSVGHHVQPHQTAVPVPSPACTQIPCTLLLLFRPAASSPLVPSCLLALLHVRLMALLIVTGSQVVPPSAAALQIWIDCQGLRKVIHESQDSVQPRASSAAEDGRFLGGRGTSARAATVARAAKSVAQSKVGRGWYMMSSCKSWTGASA